MDAGTKENLAVCCRQIRHKIIVRYKQCVLHRRGFHLPDTPRQKPETRRGQPCSNPTNSRRAGRIRVVARLGIGFQRQSQPLAEQAECVTATKCWSNIIAAVTGTKPPDVDMEIVNHGAGFGFLMRTPSLNRPKGGETNNAFVHSSGAISVPAVNNE